MYKATANDHVFKLVSNLESVIKASSSTIIDRDRKLHFVGGLACSSGDNTKKVDQFVVRRSVVWFIIEITDSLMEERWDEVVANFNCQIVDWFFL